ncbi:MAG: hypothetical protein HGA45_16050 [Chloroflexales bacterium]|nr:hypothetical protein [Chloroflexales bacterium]
MRIPRELYQMQRQITQRLPALRPAQIVGLTLWVYGAALAKSACMNAVLVELERLMPWATARQRLREWLKDGLDKARPCQTQVDVTACFPLLLRWVISWWQGSTTLPLAIDAVSHQDRVVAEERHRQCAWPSPPALCYDTGINLAVTASK